MQYIKVNVRRDESADIVEFIGAWEVPVMEAVQGERVTVGEAGEFEGRPWPEDAKSEFVRLEQKYGRTGGGDNDPSFVERVYGIGSAGVKALGEAIKAARKAGEKAARKGAKKPPAAAAADLVGATG